MIDTLRFVLAPGRLIRLGLPALVLAAIATLAGAWIPASFVRYEEQVVFERSAEPGMAVPVARAFGSRYRFAPIPEADAREIRGVFFAATDPAPWRTLDGLTRRLLERPVIEPALVAGSYAHEVRGWPFPALAWFQHRDDPRGLPNVVRGGYDLGDPDRGAIELGPLVIDPGTPEAVGGGTRKIPWPAPSADIPDPRRTTFVSNRVLPLTPVWPGIAANLVFYGVATYLVLVLAASLFASSDGGGRRAGTSGTTVTVDLGNGNGSGNGNRVPGLAKAGSNAGPGGDDVTPWARGMRTPDD